MLWLSPHQTPRDAVNNGERCKVNMEEEHLVQIIPKVGVGVGEHSISHVWEEAVDV